jgi:hypothetical protein
MSTCLICAGLEPVGTFTSHEEDAHARPFRVLIDGSESAFIDVATLEMAQAIACGKPPARILTLETTQAADATR